MMKEADILLKEINEDASVPLENAEITSISYEDGLLLQRTIAESDGARMLEYIHIPLVNITSQYDQTYSHLTSFTTI
jgi:hypothetical protein